MEKIKFCDNPKCRHHIMVGVKYVKHGIKRRGYGSLDTKLIHSSEVGPVREDGTFARLCDVCKAGFEVVMGVEDGLFKGGVKESNRISDILSLNTDEMDEDCKACD